MNEGIQEERWALLSYPLYLVLVSALEMKRVHTLVLSRTQ
jgi:hypothetical protein